MLVLKRPLTALACVCLLLGCDGRITAQLGLGGDALRATVSPNRVTLSAGGSQQFTATFSGRRAGVSWTLSEPVGTLSAGGLYTAPSSIASVRTVSVIATSAADSSRRASALVTLMPAADPPSPTVVPYGPHAGITCPAGSVNIAPGQDIPSVVNSHPPATTFCILAGTHHTTSPINPKPGDQLIGQYGAIIDGANVTMTYDVGSTSIIRGWNCGADCSGVVVRNLVLRNLATHHCIGVYGRFANNWTIDHNELHGCLNGVLVGDSSGGRITNNYVHHNIGDSSAADPVFRGGGYGSYLPDDTLYEHNEFAYNGQNQKICGSTNVTFRNNYLHHNVSDGIWYDGDNTGILVEGNTVEDHGREGIFLEISADAIVRNNIVRRSGNSGIFVSTSRDMDIYNNTLEDNMRGMQYFLNCAAVHSPGQPYPEAIGWDLRNNNFHDNIIKVGTTSGAIATDLTYLGSCTSTEIVPYLNGSKNNILQNNHYYTPDTTGSWWLWGASWRSWSQWQALPQDTTSTLALASTYAGSSGAPTGGPYTTAPVVSISNPPESSTVSGVVTIVVTASDNVGVVGVQLKVDGANVGAEVLASPYTVSWYTTGWSNGNHTLLAVARDAAGNTKTSAANTVTVSN